jgi:hypothetical protein
MNRDLKILNFPSNVKPKHAISGDIDERLIDEAIRLAELGFRIFPCHGIKNEVCQCKDGVECLVPGKRPHIKAYPKLASDSPDQIRKWFPQFPGCNYGVLSGGGLLVLDVDPRNGGDESYENLRLKYGAFPNTWTVLCRDNGFHLYFSYPKEFDVRCKTGLLPGIDIKATGGYVIGPGSIHKTGWRYQWKPGFGPDDIAIAEVPEWLIQMLTAPQKPSKKKSVQTTSTFRIPETLWEGDRNTFLFSQAVHLRDKGLHKELALVTIRALNRERCRTKVPGEPNALPDQEVIDLVNSAYSYKTRPSRKPGLSEAAEKILSWFLGRINPGESAQITIKEISLATSVSKRTVKYQTKSLFQLGYLDILSTPGYPNIFTLTDKVIQRGAKGVQGLHLFSSSLPPLPLLFPEGAVSHHLLSGGENGHSHVLTTGIRSIPTQFNGN